VCLFSSAGFPIKIGTGVTAFPKTKRIKLKQTILELQRNLLWENWLYLQQCVVNYTNEHGILKIKHW
jgi:hypothetical protein